MAYGTTPGSAGTVQAGDPGTQKATGLAGLLGVRTQKAQGPNAAAYNAERDQADQTAQTYGNLATGYSQRGPTISNAYQDQSRSDIAGNIGAQQNLASTLMNNNGEASKAQFQSGLDQSIAAQMAMANSAAGGAVGQAGATRAAAERGAMMQAQGAATAAQLGAQEREAALGQAAGVYGNVGNQLQNQYGLEQTSAIHQGMLDSANQAQQNQMRLGYGQLGNQAHGQSLDALNSYTDANLRTQGLSAGLNHNNSAGANDAIGLVSKGLGMVAGEAGIDGSPDVPPKAAYGGAIGPASNSIAAVYGPRIPAEAPSPRRGASLAEALAGVEALRAKLLGHARALGGYVAGSGGPAQASSYQMSGGGVSPLGTIAAENAQLLRNPSSGGYGWNGG